MVLRDFFIDIIQTPDCIVSGNAFVIMYCFYSINFTKIKQYLYPYDWTLIIMDFTVENNILSRYTCNVINEHYKIGM